MKISKRIIIAFVTVSLIPILVISALSAVTIYNVSTENANDAAAALENEETENLKRLASDTALFIDERMQHYLDGVYMMEEYCEALFNKEINATPTYSYYWDPDIEETRGHPVPGIDPDYEEDYDSYDISFDVSCYYMPRPYYPTPGDPFTLDEDTEYYLNVSSNMDNVYRALHEMSPDYIWLYMYFDQAVAPGHLFRNYPYDNLEYFLGDVPADDYDPQVEEWYTNAASVGVNDDSVAITSPYGDPSTGLVISMGRPVYVNETDYIGVVSADVTLDTVLANVLNIRVLDSGYAYLLESDGNVLAHPDFTTEGQTIYDLEFEDSTSSEAQAFSDILTEALASESGQESFVKNGEEWLITYEEVPNTDFLLAVVVPVSEVVQPAANILSQVLANTTFLTIILGGILSGVAVLVGVVAYRRGKAVVEPIKEMTRLVEKMSKQDFTRSVSTSGAMYEEIGTTVDALLSFQEACRFGNQAFIRGDLNRAMSNYQNLLEISRRLKISVGEQTMLLNIGNVFRQRGDTGNALDYYERALALAQELLSQAKEGDADETDAMVRVASAYHNMALVRMDRQEYDEAITLLEDARAIDETLGNRRGLAKRADAMGLVLMREGRESQAESKFKEAQTVAEKEGYDRALAYIHYHLGELFAQRQNWNAAKSEYETAINLGEHTEEYWLVVYAMQDLADTLDHLDEPTHDLRRRAEKLRRSILFKKSVIFVIDYSGSMRAQDRIRAAIDGAKEILHSQVNPQDRVSIIVFNNTYRQILPLTRKGDHDDPGDSKIVRALESLRHPNYATAFYDALGKALEDLDMIESSEHRWIIALTDGQDNSSEKYTLDALEGIDTPEERYKEGRPLTIEGYIRDNHLDVFLIIIGVGEELREPIEANVRSPYTGKRMTFEELLESVCESIPQGQYFSVVDTEDVHLDIQQAFQEVGVMMAQLEMGGMTDGY
jgi:tetratricopeptide (TPR) repeat protein